MAILDNVEMAPGTLGVMPEVIVTGGGIGGMAAAWAMGSCGVKVRVLEQSPALGEVGAGIQLGPNAVRVLDEWGLKPALERVAAFPDALVVRDASDGRELGRLRLGRRAVERYGQPYATVHRADILGLLVNAVSDLDTVDVALDQRVLQCHWDDQGVRVHVKGNESPLCAQALIGSDGLWSAVRQAMLGTQLPRFSGHLAYRGTVPVDALPVHLREPVVTAWFGPRLHVVHYPVRQGQAFNIVAVVEGELGKGHGLKGADDPRLWSHEANANDLIRALNPAHRDLMDMVRAMPEWKLWALNDRVPIASAREQAQGRVALIGDAAHPLRPYLAQGAAMAMEDAWTIGRLLREPAASVEQPRDWAGIFSRMATTRWQRNARVQERSARNGTIFHASGPLRWSRNLAMSVLGEKLMDQPWLYEGPPVP